MPSARRATLTFTGRAALGILALALIAGACGDNGGGASGGGATGGGAAEDDRQAYIDAFVDAMGDEDDVLGPEDDECLATSIVDAVGVDQLGEDGVTPDDIRASDADVGLAEMGVDMDDGQRAAFYDGLSACTDVRQLFRDAAASDGSLSDDDLDCIDRELDDDLLERFFVTLLVDGDVGLAADTELLGDLDDAAAACGLPQDG